MRDQVLNVRSAHWEKVYQTKPDHETSWHQDQPLTSLNLVREFTPRGGHVIDAGGGSSALAGRLIAEGFDVTVLDVSAAAIERAKQRNRVAADRIQWIVVDVTAIESLPPVDVWHDRAVFHFLTEASDRRRYAQLAAATVKPGGHVIISTFALDGPDQCSGLPVQRYDAVSIAAEFGPAFAVVRTFHETHLTPWGKPQQFCFTVMERLSD